LLQVFVWSQSKSEKGRCGATLKSLNFTLVYRNSANVS
jgi:hypothetical protein